MGVENLGENMQTMQAKIMCLRGPAYQEVEEELNGLHDPVSLTILGSQGPEI